MSHGRSSDERRRRLRDEIDDFVEKHKLDDKVLGIMANMHPKDVHKVITTPFPQDVRSPCGFVIASIRKVEKEANRPEGYRWDGINWGDEKSRRRGCDGGGRRGDCDSRSSSSDRDPRPRHRRRGSCGDRRGCRRGRRSDSRGRRRSRSRSGRSRAGGDRRRCTRHRDVDCDSRSR
eukprot:TRINITY_DN70792_c0_g1_i1.p1 TRINITY_DN70792_c0_g1~~TRINITY_DN70792_c0_g1_i1.p1  ORF type:complete len:176 (+),score=25.93 TRINITY_DN70792_c0_g1_i1:134-661(+)